MSSTEEICPLNRNGFLHENYESLMFVARLIESHPEMSDNDLIKQARRHYPKWRDAAYGRVPRLMLNWVWDYYQDQYLLEKITMLRADLGYRRECMNPNVDDPQRGYSPPKRRAAPLVV